MPAWRSALCQEVSGSRSDSGTGSGRRREKSGVGAGRLLIPSGQRVTVFVAERRDREFACAIDPELMNMICVRDKRGRRCGEVVVVVQECGLLPGMREEDNEELKTEDRRDGYHLYLSEPSTVLTRHPSPIGFTLSVPFCQWRLLN